jgi:plasmid maintenance system killer protein
MTCKTPRNYARSRRGRYTPLTGDRKETWSLSVTRNRRLTFRIDTEDEEIYDVNLEDYH